VPDGTPKKTLPFTETELKSLCRGYTKANIQKLGGYANGANIEPEIQLRAIGMLMDRAWGRPTQDTTHEVKGEIKVILRKMLEDDNDG
jgi:hypothetical protein